MSAIFFSVMVGAALADGSRQHPVECGPFECGDGRKQAVFSTSRPIFSILLAVPDAGKAAAWYEDALGATELRNLGSVIGSEIAGAPFFVGEPESNGWESPTTLGTTTRSTAIVVCFMSDSSSEGSLG